MDGTRWRALAVALWLTLAPQLGAALPLISEVFYDAVGSDDGLSFVEIYGAPGADLGGLVLEGVNGSNGDITHSLALNGEIPADKAWLWRREDSTASGFHR